MIPNIFGLDAAVAFLPNMIHINDLEGGQGVGDRGSFPPIGTRISKHTSAFERGE